MTRDVRIALYGDFDLNTIDGCSVWLQSLALTLALHPRNAVTVVAKAGERRDVLTRPLHHHSAIRLVNPVDDDRYPGPELTRSQALEVLTKLDEENAFDIFIMRGFALAHLAATHERQTFAGRLWPYLTDIPQRPQDLTGRVLEQLDAIAQASAYVLCQTEALRNYLESYVPKIAGKAVLLPPMIPDKALAGRPSLSQLGDHEALRLVYVGKYAPLWNTYEMTQEIAKLHHHGMRVELHMVGDKIHHSNDDPGYSERMKKALLDTPSVVWHRAKSREETLALLTKQHVALGWRAAELDNSLELSTKLLEYGAAGIPAIVNRNLMHEALLGADYPLFANTETEFCQAIVAARSATVRRTAAERCVHVSNRFTFSAVAARLQPYINRVAPVSPKRACLRVVVAGHDFHSFAHIRDHLAAVRGVELRVDRWCANNEHDTQARAELLDWADVIICEGCANNAVWYSENKRVHHKLIIRFHRFELYSPHVHDLEIENVDKVVFVSDHYRDAAIAKLSWPSNKLTVVPHPIDTCSLDRPKVAGAMFNLGMIGIAPMRKRLDRALTVLETVRATDPRFRLYIKSKLPWESAGIWDDPNQQAHYRDIFLRINSSRLLRDAVHFDPPGADVAAWLTKVGFVLSTSDDESFHLAPAKGMASRALPMLLPWPGSDALYPADWIHQDEQGIADAVLEVIRNRNWLTDGEVVRTYVEERYAVERVCAAWEQLSL